jgi:hypothetical protein
MKKISVATLVALSLCGVGYVGAQNAETSITQQDVVSGKVNMGDLYTVVSGINMTSFFATRPLPNGVTRDANGQVWMRIQTEKNIVGVDLKIHLSDLQKQHRDLISITKE